MKLVLNFLSEKLKEIEKEIIEDESYLSDDMIAPKSLGVKWALEDLKNNKILVNEFKQAIEIISKSIK